MTTESKRILITAMNSYIGNSFASWVADKEPFEIDSISCRNDEWKSQSFSEYDVILHVAGIAHIKETEENKSDYYKINRDLTIELANKAKADSVKQFIFISTMSVYGLEEGAISLETLPEPKSHYGKSKLMAEQEINYLNDGAFVISILRPPMVYGPRCKGNYSKLEKLVKIIPIFPKYENKRSMIHIDNLNNHILNIVKDGKAGISLPQNPDYISTSELVLNIANDNSSKILFTKVFNPIIKFLIRRNKIINKMFGDLTYEKL